MVPHKRFEAISPGGFWLSKLKWYLSRQTGRRATSLAGLKLSSADKIPLNFGSNISHVRVSSASCSTLLVPNFSSKGRCVKHFYVNRISDREDFWLTLGFWGASNIEYQENQKTKCSRRCSHVLSSAQSSNDPLIRAIDARITEKRSITKPILPVLLV